MQTCYINAIYDIIPLYVYILLIYNIFYIFIEVLNVQTVTTLTGQNEEKIPFFTHKP